MHLQCSRRRRFLVTLTPGATKGGEAFKNRLQRIMCACVSFVCVCHRLRTLVLRAYACPWKVAVGVLLNVAASKRIHVRVSVSISNQFISFRNVHCMRFVSTLLNAPSFLFQCACISRAYVRANSSRKGTDPSQSGWGPAEKGWRSLRTVECYRSGIETASRSSW